MMAIGSLVLEAITAPLPIEVAPNSVTSGPASTTTSTSSDVDSPIITSPTARSRLPAPRRALDKLNAILKNTSTSMVNANNNRPKPVNFPVEVRANVCALLGQVGRKATGEQLQKLSDATRSTLEVLVNNGVQGRDAVLGAAAKKTLDGWATSQVQ